MATHDLSTTAVAQRLERLRAIFVPESAEQARERVDVGLPSARPFARAVAERLAELRALSELTEHLHQARGKIA
jgi:hypothetical protein